MIKLLDIPAKVQRKGVYCWAACIEMIEKVYNGVGSPISQKDIAIEKNNQRLLLTTPVPTVDERFNLNASNDYLSNSISFCSPIEFTYQKYLYSFLDNDKYTSIFEKYHIHSQEINISDGSNYGFPAIGSISSQINAGQSLIISGIYLPGVDIHSVLVIGFSDINYYIIAVNDPYINYHFPHSSFNPCSLTLKGGRSCFIYQNLYNYNLDQVSSFPKLFKKILTVSNFSKVVSSSLALYPSPPISKLTFDSLQKSLNAFKVSFLVKTFSFTPDLTVGTSVKCYSIRYYSNLRDVKNNKLIKTGIMLMPLFKIDQSGTHHLLEFIYDVQITLGSEYFSPICIRQPYFNGYLNLNKAFFENGQAFKFNHSNPNYIFVNVPRYGYNFLSFENSFGDTFFTPVETYSDINLFFEIAYSESVFNNVISNLNLQ